MSEQQAPPISSSSSAPHPEPSPESPPLADHTQNPSLSFPSQNDDQTSSPNHLHNPSPSNSNDPDDEPELPLEFHPHPKHPIPSIESPPQPQDQQNFFFTMVDIESRRKPSKTPTQQSQPSPQLSDISKTPNPLQQVKLLLQKFNKYDTKLLGIIPLSDIHTIFSSMSIDLTNFPSVADICIMTKKDFCTFDEFLAMLNEFEQRKFEVNETKLFTRREFKVDPRLIAFIRLLDEYRKKNETLGEYKEAKSAKGKIKELKEKQAIRKEAILRILHSQEISTLENLQRKQFNEFNHQWDKYMEDYEKAAIESLETMKDRHIKELEIYDEKIKDEIPKIYYSKTILELRTKQKNLVKLQQYEEANKIRNKIDILEQDERRKYEMDTSVSLQNKINNFRVKQTGGLNALLKKIQKDRNQQLKMRQGDSERLIVKNRNMRGELMHRHQDEIKRSVEALKELMVDEGHRNEGKRKSVGEGAFK